MIASAISFEESLLWALEIGPSQRALGRTMVQKLVESVALATFLPRNLVFLVSQPLFERLHSTTASQVIAVVEGDPSSVAGPSGGLRLLEGG